MTIKNVVRRLTGAVKNAVVWGVAWSALAFVSIIGLRTIGVMVPPEIGALDAIGMAIRVGIVGGLAGGAFAVFISLFYRGRRLSEIEWVRFGLGGAVVAELFILAFFAVGGLVSGDGFPALEDVFSDLVMAAVFGGIAAGASMWLAQRAESGSIGGPHEHGRLHAGSAPPGAQDVHRTPVRIARNGESADMQALHGGRVLSAASYAEMTGCAASPPGSPSRCWPWSRSWSYGRTCSPTRSTRTSISTRP
ncbi:MAG: hypothetical protein KY467_02835 [Gemmatimonadetes bacterium]|nr:hypothetical protein [Gemmatimonadota bacterium]